MKNFLQKNGAWIGFFLLLAILAAATQGEFVSARNLTNLMRQASINGILAGGMTLIILTGGIDLSIGSLVALTGIFVGISQVQWGWSGNGFAGAVQSAVLAVGIGFAVGLINGVLIAWLAIAPFVITLGMMVIARGLSMIFSNGSSISPMGAELNDFANAYLTGAPAYLLIAVLVAGLALQYWRGHRSERFFLLGPGLALLIFSLAFFSYRGIPNLAFFLIFVLMTLAVLLSRTVLGRSIFAIGSNEKAAYWAGVAIKKTTIAVYGIMGLLAGLAGALLSSRLNGADPNAGQLFELDAIAAVVIGGTSLKGGTGSILGSLVGALMIAALNNGMDLLGVSSFYQMVFKGFIIIVAVSLDRGQRQ
jgi:ribose/xylose/arabinose/galactoside ABC-type transport system permease subunit